MTDFWKGAVIALLVAVYVASPFDLVTGPLDDGLLMILTVINYLKKYHH